MNAPICKVCGASGYGATFALCSPHGFGNVCTACEGQLSKAEIEQRLDADVKIGDQTPCAEGS